MAANTGFTFPCAVLTTNLQGPEVQCMAGVLSSPSLSSKDGLALLAHSKHLTTHLYKLCCLTAALTSLKTGFQRPNWSLPGPLLTYRTKISLQLPWQPLWSTSVATREKSAFDIFKIEESIEFQPFNTDESYKNTNVSQPTEVLHSKHICLQGEQHR